MSSNFVQNSTKTFRAPMLTIKEAHEDQFFSTFKFKGSSKGLRAPESGCRRTQL